MTGGRLLERKWGRREEGPTAVSATHVIKIGFDKREPKAANPKPGKYNGFVICRDRIDGDTNNLVVDHAIMARLVKGWTPAMLADARRLELGAPDTLLPKSLRFVLLRDAIRGDDGRWRYPDTAHEALENWDRDGLNCYGDGVTAFRRNAALPGQRTVIKCNPVGKPDVKTCELSASGACKQHLRILFCLWVPGPNGEPSPLCPDMGWDARFRLDTSSGYAGIRLMNTLDAAANRVDGSLHWLTGTISAAKQKKRYGGGVGVSVQLMFAVSELDLQKREAELRTVRGMVLGTDAAPAAKQLASDAATDGEPEPVIVGEPEPEPAPSVDERIVGAETTTLINVLLAAQDVAKSTEQLDDAASWGRVATIQLPGGKTYLPDNPGWFMDGADEAKQAARREALCALVSSAVATWPELGKELDAALAVEASDEPRQDDAPEGAEEDF